MTGANTSEALISACQGPKHPQRSCTHLTVEDGSALGLYRKFASNGASPGDRAFLYLPGQGAFDLGSLLEADPSTFGWALLGSPDATTVTGHLFGTGTLAGYGPGLPPRQFSQGVYVLRE